MASTTTNLGLTKPAYSDDADISDINGNMDLIDAEAGKVRANVAANYDSSETYAVGDYCLHDGSLYKCTTAISSPESWTAGHWTQIKIAGELSSLSDHIAKYDFAILSGTITNADGAGKNTKVNYPTGFTKDNCLVLSAYYSSDNGSSWYPIRETSYVYMNPNQFYIYNDDGGLTNKPFRIALMKVIP